MRLKFPLPKRLKEARKKAGYSQERLGVLAGMSQEVASARMNQYERGVHAPDFDWMIRIADALNVPTAYFYTLEDDLAKMILQYKLESSCKKPES